MNSNPKYLSGYVKDNVKVGNKLFVLSIQLPERIVVSPGQFAMIKGEWFNDPLLPRPLSIFNCKDDQIDFLYKIKGRGTGLLAKAKVNDNVFISVPLGNSFPAPKTNENILLIAGGLGVAPLHFFQERNHSTLLFGIASKNDVPNIKENWTLSTDDGSYGFNGNVIDLAKKELDSNSFNKIYACGPTPMLKRASILAYEFNIECFVSLESNMACGTGICHGCAWPGTDGTWPKICTDGPVFNSREVIL